MQSNNGYHEELFLTGKEYPEAHVIQRLSPKEYIEVLVLHAARRLSEKFTSLIENDQYSEMTRLASELSSLLKDVGDQFSLPLSMVTYNRDGKEMPYFQDFFLSRLNLLHNEKHSIKNFFKTLKFEMLTADSAEFMVSFIRMSGLQLLIQPLLELEQRGIPVRIITSTYLGITEAKALRRLQGFSNVTVRVLPSQTESFHTKAYLFHRHSGFHNVIIGSSNLSHSALINGHELNVKIPDSPYFPVFDQTKKVFDSTWQDPKCLPLTDDLITEYESYQRARNDYEQFAYKQAAAAAEAPAIYTTGIIPNSMQKKALENLVKTRSSGNRKGVIIAATGTGKTYLSAFDVKAVKPNRLLFIAHREELLDNAISAFQKVIPDASLYGKVTGTQKQFDHRYVFSTVQSLHRENNLVRFHSDSFDYIIIDEFHHAEAPSYKRVLEYFEPDFLLGLTATPERLDGKDVLAICDHNVVYEIRLRDALESELLAPFHYFGVSDQTIDYSSIPLRNGLYQEDALVKALSTNRRTDFIIEMMEHYGYDGDRLTGLGFCTNIAHAKYMSTEFNARGYVTSFLTGEHSISYRKEMVSKLEDDHHPLQLIFTVDIFNEGIDIPKLNLLLFLRPTESSAIFIQQLGRGLRKVPRKEFVTVLDFIGNYQKSFVVPLALSGQMNQRGFDKDSLRVAITHEFADLPGGSYVDLDPITRKEVLDRIDSIKMNSSEMLKMLYHQFRNELGRSPEILDFLYSEQSPSFGYFVHKYGKWVKVKEKMQDLSPFDEEILNDRTLLFLIERLEKMVPVKWPYELIALELAFLQKDVLAEDVTRHMEKRFGVPVKFASHQTIIQQSFLRLSTPDKKTKLVIGESDGSVLRLREEILSLSENPYVYQYIKDRIDYGIIEFRRMYHPEKFLKGDKLSLYQNYTRNDLIFLFEAGVAEGTWREGVSKTGCHYLLFINLNKSDRVEKHLHYQDYFIDQKHFHWQSQNQTSHSSTVGQNYIHHKERGIHIHLFVRKFTEMHGMTLPFSYLGEVDYVSSHGDKPMSIRWQLHHAIPEDLFMDLVR
ncbi:DUF3427 domain-containing protein [Bacillus sp. SJS]|uniref:DUF3427 domain-containing protein n=1 Tax=Bacillus sp. SJS TaxID=1423321 RepID=UPI0004DD6CB9|nr:DUF3427 domain-containing protein [Bacillus sp. SJS]KZZ83044.1 restriction endonuclease subunit R [Bacillus sp. SJS]